MKEKGQNAGSATQGGASNMDLTQAVLEGQDCSSAVGSKARDGLLSINSSRSINPVTQDPSIKDYFL